MCVSVCEREREKKVKEEAIYVKIKIFSFPSLALCAAMPSLNPISFLFLSFTFQPKNFHLILTNDVTHTHTHTHTQTHTHALTHTHTHTGNIPFSSPVQIVS